MSKGLNIVVRKTFFDQIKTGKKLIDYRDLTAFWASRLCEKWHIKDGYFYYDGFKSYDKIIFINGYITDAKKITVNFKSVKVNNKTGLFEIRFTL